MRLYENDWINICMYISWIACHKEWKIFILSHCSPWYDLAYLIWAHIWKVMHWVASQQGYSTHASPVFAHHSSFPHLGIGDFLSKGYFHVLQNIFEKDWLVRKNVQIRSFTWDHILELHTSALPQFLLPIDRYLCFRFLLHRFFPDFASPMGRQLSRLINNDTIRKKKDWGKSYILKSGIHCSNSDFYWFYLHKKEKELSPEVKMLHGQLFSHIFT